MSAISSSTTSQIERIVCDYADKQRCLLTGSGTSAIYLTLKASGLPAGSKIAIPNVACPDPAYATIWAGYTPVFIDVSLEDYNINVSALEQALIADQDIKGVIAIHLFGNACQIVRISELARKHDLFFIEDCAQALGNATTDGKLGSFGDISVFSFGRGKIVEADHGGALCTNDQDFARRARTYESELAPYDAQSIARLAQALLLVLLCRSAPACTEYTQSSIRCVF